MHTLTVVILIAIAVKTSQFPQDGEITNSITTGSPETTTNVSCVTGKGLSGTCVRREGCNYGPGGIDFTLYQPRGFKPICSNGEVCCPQEYLMQHESKTSTEKAIEFDDDD